MLKLLRTTSLSLVLAGVPLLAGAQTSKTPSIDFGRTTVQLSGSFASFIQSTGAVLTDLQGNPLQNNSFTLRAVAGAFDLTTSVGEVEHTGGLLINAAGVTARIENLTLDTTNAAAPAITAQVIYNDHFVGRIALFAVAPPAGFALPLVPQAGVLQVNNLGLSLAAPAATTLSALFGTQIPAGTAIGTANVYAVLSPTN